MTGRLIVQRAEGADLDLETLDRAIPDIADIPPESVVEALTRLRGLQSRLSGLQAGLVACVLAQVSFRSSPPQERVTA